MENENGEFREDKVPGEERSEPEVERLVRGCRRETGS